MSEQEAPTVAAAAAAAATPTTPTAPSVTAPVSEPDEPKDAEMEETVSLLQLLNLLFSCYNLLILPEFISTRSPPSTRRRSRKRRRRRRRRRRKRSTTITTTTAMAVWRSLCRTVLWRRTSLCRLVLQTLFVRVVTTFNFLQNREPSLFQTTERFNVGQYFHGLT